MDFFSELGAVLGDPRYSSIITAGFTAILAVYMWRKNYSYDAHERRSKENASTRQAEIADGSRLRHDLIQMVMAQDKQIEALQGHLEASLRARLEAERLYNQAELEVRAAEFRGKELQAALDKCNKTVTKL